MVMLLPSSMSQHNLSPGEQWLSCRGHSPQVDGTVSHARVRPELGSALMRGSQGGPVAALIRQAAYGLAWLAIARKQAVRSHRRESGRCSAAGGGHCSHVAASSRAHLNKSSPANSLCPSKQRDDFCISARRRWAGVSAYFSMRKALLLD